MAVPPNASATSAAEYPLLSSAADEVLPAAIVWSKSRPPKKELSSPVSTKISVPAPKISVPAPEVRVSVPALEVRVPVPAVTLGTYGVLGSARNCRLNVYPGIFTASAPVAKASPATSRPVAV